MKKRWRLSVVGLVVSATVAWSLTTNGGRQAGPSVAGSSHRTAWLAAGESSCYDCLQACRNEMGWPFDYCIKHACSEECTISEE